MIRFYFPAVATILFLFCAPNSTDETISFTHLTSLKDRNIVAYQSPNPLSKPDTLRVRFQYNSTTLSSIDAILHCDSRALPLEISTFSSDSQNAEILWIPKDDTAHLNITGRRYCTLELRDQNSDYSLISDTFAVIGAKPVHLIAPPRDSATHFSDTLVLRYRGNFDLISKIQVFFRPAADTNWQEITGTTSRTDDEPPIRTFTTVFSADYYASLIPDGTRIPLLFLFRDYNTPIPTATVLSDTVFLERDK